MKTINFRNLFQEVKDRKSLKSLYRKLSFENHPDRGGDVENMKIINCLYEEYFKKLKDLDFNGNETEEETKFETPEFFASIISELVKLQGIKIELIGSWLWLSGNTFIHKDKLSELSCFWSRSKKMWYWNGDDEKKNLRTHSKLEDLKDRFGCVNIKTEGDSLLNK
jgi:hypothetical protein